MASVRVRTEQAVVRATERVRYGECSRHARHARHANKADARRTARAHTRDVASGRVRCWKCRSGRAVSVFACYDWQKHYHWGHEV